MNKTCDAPGSTLTALPAQMRLRRRHSETDGSTESAPDATKRARSDQDGGPLRRLSLALTAPFRSG